MKIRDVQAALAQWGFKPGPLDGIWGRRSSAALKLFQEARGLEADGIIGPLTLAALFPTSSGAAAAQDAGGLNRTALVWFHEARRLIGTRESPGKGSNPDILDWAEDLNLEYPSDDIPWCGLFVGHCISATLNDEPTPPNLLKARAWAAFGIPTKPTVGAVMVFWRKSKDGPFGHVGFYAGEDKTAYRVLGGNQSDSVCLTWIGKDRLIAARWPSTVPPSAPEIVTVGRKESLSWNEQ